MDRFCYKRTVNTLKNIYNFFLTCAGNVVCFVIGCLLYIGMIIYKEDKFISKDTEDGDN